MSLKRAEDSPAVLGNEPGRGLDEVFWKVRVTDVERIGLTRTHGTQGVVDVGVRRLVGSNGDDQVAHRGVLRHSPVLNGEFWRRSRRPNGGVSVPVDVVNGVRVRSHRLFFQVPDESVTRARRDEIGEEKGVEKHPLRAEHGESKQHFRLAEL